MQLEVGQFSHPGRVRAKNEDWLGVFQPDDNRRLARKGSLFVLADGMGGHQRGDLASRYAVDRVIRDYVDHPGTDVAAALRQAIEAANTGLYERGSGATARDRWGTTLVAAVSRGTELWVANVGDSRAYLLRQGNLRQLTRDHGLPGQHVVTRALGTKASVKVDLFPPIELQPGDRVVLCSDGLTRPVSDDEIRDVVGRKSPQAAAEALVRRANERGGPDNVSVIVVGVGGVASGEGILGALAALGRPATWWFVVDTLRRAVVGETEGLRSPVFLVAVALFVLAIVGLGFLAGLILF